MTILYALAAAFGLGVFLLGTNVRVVKQFERGVVFRFGRLQTGVRGPGLALLMPIADRLEKVNMQIITMPVPAQDGITRDNVTVRVDAVIYFNVSDPVRVVVGVQDYVSAIGQVAQTSLRSIIGKSDLDDLLGNREGLNQGLELMIDSPAAGWGVHIDRVEIKDVVLPDSMKRSIARQAEAERERRARVITADGELQASEKLAQAAATMTVHPAALQLRLLETVVEVAAEKNSTLVLPFPVELLRFLERATPQASESRDDEAAGPRPLQRLPSTRCRSWTRHRSPTMPAVWKSTHAPRVGIPAEPVSVRNRKRDIRLFRLILLGRATVRTNRHRRKRSVRGHTSICATALGGRRSARHIRALPTFPWPQSIRGVDSTSMVTPPRIAVPPSTAITWPATPWTRRHYGHAFRELSPLAQRAAEPLTDRRSATVPSSQLSEQIAAGSG